MKIAFVPLMIVTTCGGLAEQNPDFTDLLSDASRESDLISYTPRSTQTLIVLGDFSIDSFSRERPEASLSSSPPQVSFMLLSHATASSEKPIRLRVINGMPQSTLTFANADGKTHTIAPGQMETLTGQPPIFQYSSSVEGQEIQVLMRQDGVPRNAMLIYFLKEGQPAFMRVFEN